MKKTILSFITLAALGVLTSCSYDRSPEGKYDPNNPGFEFAPEGDMYHAVPYEPLSQSIYNTNPYNRDSMNMRLPVKGTIARNKLDYYYPYDNTSQGYEQSAAMKNPITKTAATSLEGKRLYEIYCWQCHGKEDAPKGSLVELKKFPPPTWDFERPALLASLSEGKMYHAITYGKNLMGPHGFIVEPQQRWMIIQYLKEKAGGTQPNANTAKTDSSATTGMETANQPNSNL